MSQPLSAAHASGVKDRRDHAAFYLNLSRTGGDLVPYRVGGRAAFLVNRPEYAERHPYTYFPFGGGARKCPAGHFVAGHLQTVLAVLLRPFRVEAASDERVRPRGLITLRPDPGVLVRFTPRGV